jgi:hypothetical protein
LPQFRFLRVCQNFKGGRSIQRLISGGGREGQKQGTKVY